MKNILSLLIFFGIQAISAQTWRTVNQSDFNVKYKLPSDWEIDGFGGSFGEWDEGGSSVCDCAGTINFGYDRKLGMVLYPFSNASAESEVMRKRDYVWDYHYIFSSKVNKPDYVTKKLTFTIAVSKWELPNDTKDYSEMLDDEVWFIMVSGKNYGLIIYFWGDSDLMKKNESTLYKILDSIVMIKN